MSQQKQFISRFAHDAGQSFTHYATLIGLADADEEFSQASFY
jgi:hypothetical protein